MSIFSVFKRGRRREKEKSEKSAEGKQRQDTKSAYKDVPNRGAIDEFLNTPPTSRTKDRPRIAEGHRRGSSVPNVAINGTHSSGTPRVPSGLSNVMYPAAHADPTVTTQRTYSFQGPLQLHHENNKMNANIVHPVPEPLYVPEVLKLPSGKGKELERGFTPGSSRTPSLIADKGSGSVASSNNSIISQDDLKPRPSEGSSVPTRSTAALPTGTAPVEETPVPNDHSSTSAQGPKIHRLHPSRQRKLSDASIDKPLSGSLKRTYVPRYTREPGPPPSTRGFSSIPSTPPSVPPLPEHTSFSQSLQSYANLASSSSSIGSIDSTASSLRGPAYHGRKTTSSSVSSAGSSGPYKAYQHAQASSSAIRDFVFPFTNELTTTVATDPSSEKPAATPIHKAAPKAEAQRFVNPAEKTGQEAESSQQSVAPGTRPASLEARPLPYRTNNPPSPLEGSKPKNYYPPKVARFNENVTEIPPEPTSRPARPTNWLKRRFSGSSGISVDSVTEPPPAEPGSIAEAAERVAREKESKGKSKKLVRKRRHSVGTEMR